MPQQSTLTPTCLCVMRKLQQPSSCPPSLPRLLPRALQRSGMVVASAADIEAAPLAPCPAVSLVGVSALCGCAPWLAGEGAGLRLLVSGLTPASASLPSSGMLVGVEPGCTWGSPPRRFSWRHVCTCRDNRCWQQARVHGRLVHGGGQRPRLPPTPCDASFPCCSHHAGADSGVSREAARLEQDEHEGQLEDEGGDACHHAQVGVCRPQQRLQQRHAQDDCGRG